LDELVNRAGGDALHIGFLNDGGQCLFTHPPRLQKAWEVTAPAQLRDTQFHRARPGFPDPVTVTVALRQTLGAATAMRRTGQALAFEFHQPLGGEADHLAQAVGIGGLFQQLT
jgi:hypothetical protein